MDGNNSLPIFATENGVVKIVNARIAMANIDDLFVKGTQIEPGAVSLAKNQQIPGGNGNFTRDIVLTHGIAIGGAHHEMRFEYSGYASVTGSTSTNAYVTCTDAATGVQIYAAGPQIRGPNHPDGQLNAEYNVFKYYSIPSDGRTSTTFRFTYSSSANATYSVQQFGCFVFKNVPNNV